MEEFIRRFFDAFPECRDSMENRILNSMILNLCKEEKEKKTMLHVIEKFNEHGVSSKVLFEVCEELVREGVFEDVCG